jgi:hypothetical protein
MFQRSGHRFADKNMRQSLRVKRVLLGSLAGLACLASVPLLFWRGTAAPTSLEVAFKLTDDQYQPLAGVPVRLVFGTPDWQAPDAGIRVVTGDDGTARFTTTAVVGRRWNFVNIGFTPFSMPFRADHLAVAAELAFVVPQRDGGEATHRWLYTADINRLPDGDCNTNDLDKVYAAGADGRFTQLVGANAAGPNFSGTVDGMMLGSAGYKLSDFMLSRRDGADRKAWNLKLAIVRKPKPMLVK